MIGSLPVRAIVTGASGGIGSVVARRLRLAGVNVSGWDLVEGDEVTNQIDLSSRESVYAVVSEYCAGIADVESLGVVHAAARQPSGSIGSLVDEDWMDTLAVNVICVDAIVQSVLSSKRIDMGTSAVVCIGSVHQRASAKSALPYAVSKHALHGWVRSAALELADVGTRVNMVSPGAVDTAMLRDGLSARSGSTLEDLDHALSRLSSRTPLGRIGAPSDVASAVEFLLSDRSSFMTGCDLVADGGVSLQLASETVERGRSMDSGPVVG